MVHLHNVSGGILSGDSLSLSVDAGTSTRVQITSVGATRIYRHRAGRDPALLTTSIRVGDGAMLEYLPDGIIPFSGSRFSQSTAISLGPNAGFIGWETLAAGRVASGEEFGFDFFHSEFSVASSHPPARTGALFSCAVYSGSTVRCPMGPISLLEPPCMSAIPASRNRDGASSNPAE